MSVTLEDVFNGKMVKLNHNRKKCCEGCDGKGGANQRKCTTCKGQGMVIKMQMLGPGMYQQSQQPCSDCMGQGVVVDEKDKCKKCNGKKLAEVKSTIECAVEPGCPNEHTYVFHSMADEQPGVLPGDVHIRINIDKHKEFVRKGADLFVEKKITLLEALTGTNYEIKHLDGKKYKVSTLPGEVISHEETKCIKGKGMPFFKDAMGQGNLYVKFKVQMPKRGELTKEQMEQIKTTLPGP